MTPPDLVVELPTGQGRAAAHVSCAVAPVGIVVLGHGAGGGVGAADLVALAAALPRLGWSVALVEQPYRVAGRRVPPRAPVLDDAWTDALAALRRQPPVAAHHGLPLVVGGRSAGARVACRTAVATGAVGVVCLAFPTQPPGRPDRPSRLPELDAAGVPVLVVQGATDPYGVPPEGPRREVVVVAGDHGLKEDVPGVVDAVAAWLGRVLSR